MNPKEDICDFCSCLGDVFCWRMADVDHERIPGNYSPVETGRGIHLLCESCSYGMDGLCRGIDGAEV